RAAANATVSALTTGASGVALFGVASAANGQALNAQRAYSSSPTIPVAFLADATTAFSPAVGAGEGILQLRGERGEGFYIQCLATGGTSEAFCVDLTEIRTGKDVVLDVRLMTPTLDHLFYLDATNGVVSINAAGTAARFNVEGGGSVAISAV